MNKKDKDYNVSKTANEPIKKHYQSKEEREKTRSKDLEQGSEKITSEGNFREDEATNEELKESYEKKDDKQK